MPTPIAFQRQYELRLYKNRRIDPTETALLEQRENAAETFIVTTDPTDGRPQLEMPAGYMGEIQVPKRTVTSADITVRVSDRGEGDTPATSLERTITKFMGDAAGANQTLGVKAELREIEEGVPTAWFTGRVTNFKFNESKLWAELSLTDLVDELRTEIFLGRPHPSLSYAKPCNLLPPGFGADYGPDRPETIRGAMDSFIGTGAGNIRIDGQDIVPELTMVTSGLHEVVTTPGSLRPLLASPLGEEVMVHDEARVWVKILTGARAGEEGEFWLARTVRKHGPEALQFPASLLVNIDQSGHWITRECGIAELDATDPDYMALPPVNEDLEFRVYRYGEPTPSAPTLLKDVHVAQLESDILSGYFGPLDAATQNPLVTFGQNAAAFATLIADDTLPTVTILIEGSAKAKEFLEKLNLGTGLGYRINRSAEYVPLDWRLTDTDPSSYPEITDADVHTGKESFSFEDSAERAITRVDVLHYIDEVARDREFTGSDSEIPPIPSSLIRTRRIRRVRLFDRYGNLTEADLEIDAIGLRELVRPGIDDGGVLREANDKKADSITRPLRSIYGSGPSIITLRCRRTDVPKDTDEGDVRRITVRAVPDKATNRRGGTRLARCVRRNPEGPSIWLTFEDLGPASVAVAPTIGAIAQNGADPRNTVDVPVTLNAAAEEVVLEVALTATSAGARPAATSDLWRLAAIVDTTGTVGVKVPAGFRAWIRGRTEPGSSDGPRIPGSWVFPTGPGYVDSEALPAPTDLVVTVEGTRVIATCTPGDVTLQLSPIMGLDPAAPTPVRSEPLPPGSARYPFTGLVANQSHTLGFRTVDGRGGRSADTTTAVLAGDAQELRAPIRLQILQGRTASMKEESALGQTIGFGLWVGFHPLESYAKHEVRVSTDPAFATVELQTTLAAGVYRAPLIVARDEADATRYVQFRATRDGEVSDWSSTIGAKPTELLARPGPDTFPGGYAELREGETGFVELHCGNGGDEDGERFYYEFVIDSLVPNGYPDVDENDRYIEAADFPYVEILTNEDGTNVAAIPGRRILLHGWFWSSITGFGQEVFVPLYVTGTLRGIGLGIKLRRKEANETHHRVGIEYGTAVESVSLLQLLRKDTDLLEDEESAKWALPAVTSTFLDPDQDDEVLLLVPPPNWIRECLFIPRAADPRITGPAEDWTVNPLGDRPDKLNYIIARGSHEDGSMEFLIGGSALGGSVRLAWNEAENPADPDIEDVEASGGAASGGALVDLVGGVGFLSLPAETVARAHRLIVWAVGYLNEDGTGADGVTDHSDPVSATWERTKFVAPEWEVVFEDEVGDEGVLQLRLKDPDGLLSLIQEREKVGADTFGGFAVKSASPVHDTVYEFRVDLGDGKHKSHIQVVGTYEIGGATKPLPYTSRGFDPGYIPTFDFAPRIDEEAGTGTIVAGGDSDLTTVKAVAVLGLSEPADATVDAATPVPWDAIPTLINGLVTKDVVTFKAIGLGPNGEPSEGGYLVRQAQVAILQATLRITTEEIIAGVFYLGVTVEDLAGQSALLYVQIGDGSEPWDSVPLVLKSAAPATGVEYVESVVLTYAPAQIRFILTQTLFGKNADVEATSAVVTLGMNLTVNAKANIDELGKLRATGTASPDIKSLVVWGVDGKVPPDRAAILANGTVINGRVATVATSPVFSTITPGNSGAIGIIGFSELDAGGLESEPDTDVASFTSEHPLNPLISKAAWQPLGTNLFAFGFSLNYRGAALSMRVQKENAVGGGSPTSYTVDISSPGAYLIMQHGDTGTVQTFAGDQVSQKVTITLYDAAGGGGNPGPPAIFFTGVPNDSGLGMQTKDQGGTTRSVNVLEAKTGSGMEFDTDGNPRVKYSEVCVETAGGDPSVGWGAERDGTLIFDTSA